MTSLANLIEPPVFFICRDWKLQIWLASITVEYKVELGELDSWRCDAISCWDITSHSDRSFIYYKSKHLAEDRLRFCRDRINLTAKFYSDLPSSPSLNWLLINNWADVACCQMKSCHLNVLYTAPCKLERSDNKFIITVGDEWINMITRPMCQNKVRGAEGTHHQALCCTACMSIRYNTHTHTKLQL